jgi:hypothetical protein
MNLDSQLRAVFFQKRLKIRYLSKDDRMQVFSILVSTRKIGIYDQKDRSEKF